MSGHEPYAVFRDGRRVWLHAQAVTADLDPADRDELAAWLAANGVDELPAVVTVTRDDQGLLELAGAEDAQPVDADSLPECVRRQ